MSIALYRRFRPEAFNEVIGQEQVTVPLMAALRAGKVNHAYLFSGPRGCGKTTSARILARTLNCARNTEANPLDTPCGECESCVELSRLGGGSLDVVEIDAASHGGVDAARDLRERATFTPSRDRFKIFIIDEAHMVTKEGFNALLKVVEEPPPHIKFIFATTEPDKVLGTIRSRTHHYPFRLVPADILAPYLEQLAGLEGASLGPGVIPLVIKAGGGSVRDSLSVLDQLIAGSSDGNVTYDGAVALLGYTPAAMLDDAVNALAAGDGAELFQVIDRVIDNGNPPQRFAEDLLQRFRDLIIVSVTGEGAGSVFRDWPADQLALAKEQAAKFDLATMTRLGESISAGLATMVGATSPRLQLELLCARLLVPIGPEQLAARISNIEHTLATGAIPIITPAAGTPAAPVVPAELSSQSPRQRSAARLETRTQPSAAPPQAAPVNPPHAAPVISTGSTAGATTAVPPAQSTSAVPPTVAPVVSTGSTAGATTAVPPAMPTSPRHSAGPAGATQNLGAADPELEQLKATWAQLVESIPSPVTKSILRTSSGPVSIDQQTVQIGFENQILVDRLAEPRHADALSYVVSERLGRPIKAIGAVPGASPLTAPPASHATTPPRRPSPATPRGPVGAQGQATGASGSAKAATENRPAAGAIPKVAPKPVDSSWEQADAAWLAGEAIPLKVPAADPVTQSADSQKATGGEHANAQQLKVGPASISKVVVSPPESQVDTDIPEAAWTAEPDEPDTPGEQTHQSESGLSSAPIPTPSVSKPPRPQRTAASEDEADPDDAIADQTFLSGVPLVVEMLSGTIVGEEPL